MSPRERFRETLLFGKPDKVPLSPGGPRESTLAVWHKQGLPEGVNWHQTLLDILGIKETREEPQKPRVYLGASFKMIPTFEEKVLEHKDGHYIVQDWMGAITEISDEYDYAYIRSPRDFVTRSMISPKMVRQVLLPVYQRWVPEIKKGGCPVVSLDEEAN